MKFSISTTLNLMMTGVIAIGGVTGLDLTPTTETTTQQISSVEAKPAPPVREELSVIKADPEAKVSFDRPSVTSKAAPKPKPKPKPLLKIASVDPEAQSSTNFNVAATIKAAQSELGKSFATGWNMPGECLVAANRWIKAGGGNWYGAGTPIGNYAGAKEVEYKNAAPGDVIQYLSPKAPEEWVNGVHTVLVVKNNGDGTLHIIEANNPGGSGFVSENKTWKAAPPEGLVAKVFRF